MLTRKIDEFELENLIGSGTAGRIYDAVENTTRRKVAVKILPSDVSKDRNTYIRFEREMVILSKLNHPNIVEYLGGGRHEESLFYAMEKVEGGTLQQLIARHGRLTWQETVRYGIRICSALQYMHNFGIVHRDLKPSNIFMTVKGEIKLGDFGIAFDSGESQLTASGLIVGSYAYMSPEQIRGNQQVDSRTDLYALGCVLFEMLSGHPPYRGDTFAKIFDQHLTAEIPPISNHARDLPKPMTKLIGQLMQKERHLRPFNARAAQGALSELKLSWRDGESLYQKEISRLHQAFDKKVVSPHSHRMTWGKLAFWISAFTAIGLLSWLIVVSSR
ncbi:MAG: serine/threonine-protein kinase [Pirellulaceae bacterium]|nr:serine/threonine protein kinase [bacterium]MDG2467971.1 serine/threonine-protein kinase [Pirellulaceae bacterium]